MSPPPSLPQLVEDLRDLAARHGAPAKDTTLTAASTAALFLGVDPATGGPLLRALAGSPDLAAGLLRIWGRWEQSFPYLHGNIGPLTRWLEHPAEHHLAALRAQLTHLTQVDLLAIAEGPSVRGDLLGQILTLIDAPGDRAARGDLGPVGQILTLIDAPGDRAARGAFFTPPALAGALSALAGVTDLPAGAVITDPCVGGGGLVVAAVRAMRAAGTAPEARRWILQDVDPFAVAIAGVAMSIHGIPWVELSCSDTLGTPHPREKQFSQPELAIA